MKRSRIAGVVFLYMAVILVMEPHIRHGDDRLHLLAQVRLACLPACLLG